MTQWVICTFKPGEGRRYTYQNDGDLVAIGDKVKVNPPRATSPDEWVGVWVAAIAEKAPAFECKPILGKVEPIAPDPAPTNVEAGDDDDLGNAK